MKEFKAWFDEFFCHKYDDCKGCCEYSKHEVFSAWEARQPEIDKLKEENKIMRECVEYYANVDNWSKQHQIQWTIINKTDHELGFARRVGGKLARQVLRVLEEKK